MTDPRQSTGVLVVDDEPESLKLIKRHLESEGYTVFTANNGAEGFEILQQHRKNIYLILLDRIMPKMDGIQFIKKLKANETIANIPVIMQTSASLQRQIAEGIAAGAYYYLTKPYTKETLLSITRSAISSYTETKTLLEDLLTYKTRLHLVKESFFEVSTLDDIRYLSTFLANFYPQSERVVHGISELLLNAVEHGNLAISYQEKSQLMLRNTWLSEIKRRCSLAENKNKKVQVHYKRHSRKITLQIKDEGNGFDWHNYMEIQSDRATHNHGRGIALAKMMSFDDIQYLGNGNELICTVLL